MKIKLEKICDQCKGEIWYRPDGYDREIQCPYCDGRGTILTEFGEEILEFIKKRLKLEIK